MQVKHVRITDIMQLQNQNDKLIYVNRDNTINTD